MDKCIYCGTDNSGRKCGASKEEQTDPMFRCGGSYAPREKKMSPVVERPDLFQLRNFDPLDKRPQGGEGA